MAKKLSTEEIERGIKGLLFKDKSDSLPSTSRPVSAASDIQNKSPNVSTPVASSPLSSSQRKREKAKLRKQRKRDQAKALSESEANETKQQSSPIRNLVEQNPAIHSQKNSSPGVLTKNDEAVQNSRKQRRRDKANALSESEAIETKQDGSHSQNSVGRSPFIHSGNHAKSGLETNNHGTLQSKPSTPIGGQGKKSKQHYSSTGETPDVHFGEVDGSNTLDVIETPKESNDANTKVQTIHSEDNIVHCSVEDTPDSHKGLKSGNRVSNACSELQEGTSSTSTPESKSQSVDQPKHGTAREGVQETLQNEEKKMVENLIFPLKKKSDKFPKAKYFCRLCDYHCDDVQHCMKHIKDTRHCRLKQLRDEDKLLHCLPYPTPAHISAVNDVMVSIYSQSALEPAELDKRWQAISQIQEVITKKLPELSLLPYGSTVTGFGLMSSDINLDIVYRSGHNPAQVLMSSLEALQESEGFTSVHSDFSAKYPSITVIVDKLECLLGVDNGMACETSQLLETYAKVDPRVLQLGVIFRHWAKLCKIDSQEDGTLPAHSLALMTVYFLQQVKPPVLPCLHGIGTSSQENPHDYFKDIKNLSKVWRTTNEMCLGELWINLLKFYSVDFNMADNIVGIRQPGLLLKKDKKWGSKRLAIEDPFSTKRNLTRSVSHSELFEYIQDCIRSAYKYFAIPQLKSGPLITKVEMRVNPSSASLCSNSSHGNTDQPLPGSDTGSPSEDIGRPEDDIDSPGKSKKDTNRSGGPKVHNNTGTPTEASQVKAAKEKNASQYDINKLVALLESKSSPVLFDSEGVLVDLKRLKSVVKKDLVFELKPMGEEEGPPMVCKICQKKGHLKQNCPEEKLPRLLPLPKMNKTYEKLLTDVLIELLARYEPSHQEVRSRDDVVYNLERFLQEIYLETRLTLFGSSRNGFGFRNSDLDICMTFDQPTAEGLDCEEIINKVATKIKKHRDFFQVLAITTAKVPIVKFQYRHSRTRDRLEGDISLYNTLAQENTRMLRTYASIDNRVKVLGYVIKVFAKACDIGDASRGSLSSYAYTLMTLYYLQQCKPPVIPVLQELYDPKKGKPKVLVEGCNVWFYDDLSNLSKVWSGMGKNKQSVAQLWVGLLRFYTEQFNITKDVVCIRQHKPLTRFEKMWNGKCFAIEDPFELNHNLGAGLSHKMQWFIMKAFINVRNLHGVPVSENDIFSDYEDILDFFFDGELLNDGEYAPNDRGCRVCGKIGHIAKDCAVVKMRKEREQKAKERKQKQKAQQEHQQRSLGKGSNQDNRVRHAQTPPRQTYQRSESAPIPVNPAHTHFRSPPKPSMVTVPTYDNKGQPILGSPSPQVLLGSPPLQFQMLMQPRPADPTRPPLLPTPQGAQQVPLPGYGSNNGSQAPSLHSNSPQVHGSQAIRQQQLYQQQYVHQQQQQLLQQQQQQQLQQQQQQRQQQQQQQHQLQQHHSPGQYSGSPSRQGFYASPPRQALQNTGPHVQANHVFGQQTSFPMTVYDEAQFQKAVSSGIAFGVSPQNRSPPNLYVSVSPQGQRPVAEVKGQGYGRGSGNS